MLQKEHQACMKLAATIHKDSTYVWTRHNCKWHWNRQVKQKLKEVVDVTAVVMVMVVLAAAAAVSFTRIKRRRNAQHYNCFSCCYTISVIRRIFGIHG